MSDAPNGQNSTAQASTQPGFVPADPNRIEAALGHAVSRRDDLYHLSSSSNMIVLASCRSTLSEFQALIDALALVHPGRYFALYQDEQARSMRVEVSARCYGLSQAESVCSEVIMIGAPRQGFVAVPSVVLAHLLSGSPVELFLCDPCSDAQTIELFLPMVETLLFSSSHYFRRPAMLRDFAVRVPALVDLEWINLGVWRRQLARVFDRPGLRQLLPQLAAVEVRGAPESSQPYLFGGWIAARLGARDAGGGRFVRDNGAAFNLAAAPGAPGTVGLQEVTLRLGDGARRAVVRLKRGEALETVIEGVESYAAAEPFGDESWEGRLRAYFETGESTANFKASLAQALAIAAL